MFQMARDGDVPGLETLLKRLGPPKSARVISKLNTLGTVHILRKHLYNIKLNFNLIIYCFFFSSKQIGYFFFNIRF